MDKKTTDQAASELGISRSHLITYISRHPELRPAGHIPKANFLLWTDEEIQAVREARAIRGNGRPKKQKA